MVCSAVNNRNKLKVQTNETKQPKQKSNLRERKKNAELRELLGLNKSV